MLKVVKIPLGGFPNRHIHQSLIKPHGNNPVVSMCILFTIMTLSHIMDDYTKIKGLCCWEQVIGISMELTFEVKYVVTKLMRNCLSLLVCELQVELDWMDSTSYVIWHVQMCWIQWVVIAWCMRDWRIWHTLTVGWTGGVLMMQRYTGRIFQWWSGEWCLVR